MQNHLLAILQKLKFSTFATIMLFSLSIKSQTPTIDQQLLEKYWNYREKFKRQFIAFPIVSTPVNGAGIPINNINTGLGDGSMNPQTYFVNDFQDVGSGKIGIMKQGDEGEQLANYICVLATEWNFFKGIY